MNPHRLRAYILLTLVALIWGLAGAVIKFTLGQLTPFVFLTYRFFLTCLILVPLTIATRQSFPKNPRDILTLFIVSVFGSTLNLGLLFWGINLTSVLDQGIIAATSPILVVLGGAIFLKETVTRREKIGIAIAFLGALLVVAQPLLTNSSDSVFHLKNLAGNLLVFASNFAWMVYALVSKKALRDKMSPLTLTTSSFFVGLVTTFPLALNEAGGVPQIFAQISRASISSHLGVAYMALISGALAYFLYQYAQKSIEASEASLFSYLQGIFTIPFAIVWLRETLTLPFVIGAMVTTLGVVIAETKRKLI